MDSDTFYVARVQPSGFQFDSPATQTLLVAAEMGGLDWPSSCRNGTCRTCIATLHSGRVRYDIEWPGLSAEEKADGQVLPCVAYPCSDVVLSR